MKDLTEVVVANQRVHSTLANIYNESEPHFRPENQAKVRARIEALSKRLPSTDRMLDLGCGTGFLLNLAHDLFTSIDGVDATPEMLARVDLSPGNITLHNQVVEKLPFEDATFDFVTAYSFLDHVQDHVAVIAEAARVLRPGGILYIDLIPNRNFWNAIYAASADISRPLHPIVEREINELVNHEKNLQDKFGIDPVDWRNAEPAKSGGQGFDPITLKQEADNCGLETSIEHEWFLGEAVVLHGDSPAAAATIDAHLEALLPVSSQLFKYLVLTAVKK